MDKKSKIIIVILLAIFALLAFGVYMLSYKIATIENSIINIANNQSLKPTVINGKDGVDGLNGESGINGFNGKDGIDSKSTYVKETFYEPQAPTNGTNGKDGENGVGYEPRINPETKDLEMKASNSEFWTVMIKCEELIKSCPSVGITAIEGKK